MKKYGLATTSAALIIVGLRIYAAKFDGPLWGINTLRYLAIVPAVIWIVTGALLLLGPLLKKETGPGRQDPSKPWPAWSVGAMFLVLACVFPSTATPLLGDGLDRIEATIAGWKSLEGQPAPLDLIIHVMVYKAGILSADNPWQLSWKVWRILSWLSCGMAAAFVWKLACLRGGSRGERVFIFFTIFASGTLIFFFGYVENYVTLAAGLYGFLALLELAGRGKAPVWTIFPALAVLVGLHFFMVLLVPAVLYALYRNRFMRPSPLFLCALGILAIGFCAFALVVVREHYGGLAAIFVAPADIFGSYHLLGFFNQQLLACPTLPLLVPLAFFKLKKNDPDPLISFTGAASLILIVFFFFLRPVIGAAPDWDLFAIPSLVFTPWLVLRFHKSWKDAADFPLMGRAIIVLAVVSVGPWLSINSREHSSIRRFQDLLEWEAGHNTWAASYGYYRLGKYLGVKGDKDGREVVAALNRAVAINPDSATLRLQVARAMSAFGQPERARLEMAEHHRLKAEYEMSKQRYLKAIGHYEKALGFSPGSRKILEALAKLYETRFDDREKAAYYRSKLNAKTPRTPR